MSKAIIIPARYESVRFPGKPLAKIAGMPMIEWIINAARGSKLAERIIVATENETIFELVREKLGTEAYLTSKNHQSGTDRIAEVVKNNPDIKHIVNLQADEPLIPSGYIDKAFETLSLTNGNSIATLMTHIRNNEDIANPDIVKVVADKNNFALYFSRAHIPYPKNKNASDADKTPGNHLYYRHIGIYAYSRDVLLLFSSLPQTPLEKTEQLEQLRALENGIKIKLAIVEKAFPAVDKPRDIQKVEEVLTRL